MVIILLDSKDYTHWIENTKTAALKYDVWKYCNPDIKRADLQLLKEPVRPRPADIMAPLGEAIFLMELEDYAWEIERYDRQREALADLRMRIQETVHIDNLFYTFNCDTTYDMLSKLKARFAPTDREREQKVVAQFQSPATRKRGRWRPASKRNNIYTSIR